MWTLIALSLLGLSADVEATTLAGAQSQGALGALGADGVVLKTAAGEQKIALTDLLSLKPQLAPKKIDKSKPSVWISLVDDTRLLGTSFVSMAGMARVTLVGGESLEIPTRSIRWVRFQDQDTELAKQFQLARQWQEILASQPQGDVIVVRKATQSEEPVEEGKPARTMLALDQLEGVLGDVSEEKVGFTYEEQQIPVARTKVEGILYFHPAGRELPEPLCRLDDASGNRWQVKSVALAGEVLQVVSVAGVKAEVPLMRWQQLDYSAGKIVYLSDLEPETSKWTNAFGTSTTNASLERLFSPRRDQGFDGDKLMLFGRVYEKGLALHSRTLVEYRLNGKYSKFVALAGIDDRVRPGGDLKLAISLDGKLLGEHRVRGKDLAAVDLQYDIRGGRKLSLQVDFGEGLDISDRLHLVNARVTK